MKVTGSVKGRGLNRPEFMRAAKAALEGGRYKIQVQQDENLMCMIRSFSASYSPPIAS